MPHVLIVTHEMLPLPGGPASGGGLRVQGLARGLESHGLDVSVSMPRAYLEGREGVPQALLDASYEVREIHELIQRLEPDVLILEQPRQLGWFQGTDIPTVIDLPGPLFLEQLYLGRPAEAEIRDKVHALSYGDRFLVSHPRQKAYALAWLALAGVDLTAEHLDVVPFGFPPELPQRASASGATASPGLGEGPGSGEEAADAERDGAPGPGVAAGGGEPVFVYAGTFHPWQDPVPGLTALHELLVARGRGRIEVIGGKHPVDLWGEGVYHDPRERLPRSERLSFVEPMAWDAFNARLASAAAGVNLLTANVEREHAFPIRELNYLWAGLPVLVSPESPFGPEILRAGAGWVVGHDGDGLAEAVDAVLAGGAPLEAASRAAQAVVADGYTWDTAVAPLAAYCKDPVRRIRRGSSFLVAATEREELSRYVGELAKVAEAHKHTEQRLAERDEAYAALEGKLAAAGEEQAELAEALEASRAAGEALRAERDELLIVRDALQEDVANEHAARVSEVARADEQAARAADFEQRWHAEQRHKQELSHRLAGDLEHQRRRAVAAEQQLYRLRRSVPYRAFQLGRRLARPLIGVLMLALGVLVAWRWAPGWLEVYSRLAARAPWLTHGLAALVGLLALVVLIRFRFRWSWLTPTRHRSLGLCKLAGLAALSLVMTLYLKVWERVHRIRVFP